MIDTHCHLTHAKLRNDERAIVERAVQAGLEACVSIGTGVEDAERVRDLTGRHPGFVYGTAGLDPFSAHHAGDGFDDALDRLTALLAGGGFVAVGEIGLDYHYDLDPRPVQAERFERQLELAMRLDLPVVIHVREAHEDMAAILTAHPGNRGVIHSFTAGPAEAARYLALGWYLAFNGVATFPRATAVHEAARSCPADRLLIETDAPYLAPVPQRGKRCEPAYLAHTLAHVARTRQETPPVLSATTSANARRLFGLPDGGAA
jgi:TatD DNase family protein